MATYYCGRCGTKREDKETDAIWTSEGWLCLYCQNSEHIAELVARGHPFADAKRIVAMGDAPPS